MKASVYYYPNKAKKSDRTGKTPIYIRVTLNRKKVEERLSIDLTESDVMKWDPMTMRIQDRSANANFILNNLDQKFQEFLILNITGLSNYDSRSILNFILGKTQNKQVRVLDFVNTYYTQSVMNNGTLSIGTKLNYKKALNHFDQFLIHRKSEKLLVGELNAKFVYEFKDYLLSKSHKYTEKAMCEVSAANIIKKFRTIFDRAVEQGLMEKNYFKILKLKTRSPRRERLNIDQVKQLYFLNCADFPTQRTYLDIFLFSILTGLAYVDAQALKKEHIIYTENGPKLNIKRTKTSGHTESFLVKQAAEILERYQNSSQRQITGYLLPHRSLKEINLQLKLIGNLCTEIPFKLTSHIARHTFRQLLAEAGIEDIGVIKRLMGQSRGDEIDDIYYSITDSRLLAAKEKFETYLDKNFCINGTDPGRR